MKIMGKELLNLAKIVVSGVISSVIAGYILDKIKNKKF